MSGIEGLPPPPEKKLYEQEYLHGVDLFQRALDQCTQAEEVHKKAAFKEVMERALQALNDTARGLKREDLQKHNDELAKDLKVFEDQENVEAQQKLAQDLDRAKKLI